MTGSQGADAPGTSTGLGNDKRLTSLDWPLPGDRLSEARSSIENARGSSHDRIVIAPPSRRYKCDRTQTPPVLRQRSGGSRKWS
jgi:hypothetical protein